MSRPEDGGDEDAVEREQRVLLGAEDDLGAVL